MQWEFPSTYSFSPANAFILALSKTIRKAVLSTWSTMIVVAFHECKYWQEDLDLGCNTTGGLRDGELSYAWLHPGVFRQVHPCSIPSWRTAASCFPGIFYEDKDMTLDQRDGSHLYWISSQALPIHGITQDRCISSKQGSRVQGESISSSASRGLFQKKCAYNTVYLWGMIRELLHAIETFPIGRGNSQSVSCWHCNGPPKGFENSGWVWLSAKDGACHLQAFENRDRYGDSSRR